MTGPVGGGLGPVRWVVTDRTGGAGRPPYDTLNLASHVGDDPGRVAANRAVVAGWLGVDPGRLVVMRPTHGAGVATVDAPAPGEVDGVDALVTATPGLALLAMGADCVPVLLADPRAGVVAAVHCGWRGLVADVTGAALAAMDAAGARLERVQAWLGPAICGRCYPVPAQRRDLVAARLPSAAARARDGQPAVDLRAGLAGRLAAAGVAATLVGGCTREDPLLFSHRRDGVTGRHGAAIVVAAA